MAARRGERHFGPVGGDDRGGRLAAGGRLDRGAGGAAGGVAQRRLDRLPGRTAGPEPQGRLEPPRALGAGRGGRRPGDRGADRAPDRLKPRRPRRLGGVAGRLRLPAVSDYRAGAAGEHLPQRRRGRPLGGQIPLLRARRAVRLRLLPLCRRAFVQAHRHRALRRARPGQHAGRAADRGRGLARAQLVGRDPRLAPVRVPFRHLPGRRAVSAGDGGGGPLLAQRRRHLGTGVPDHLLLRRRPDPDGDLLVRGDPLEN